MQLSAALTWGIQELHPQSESARLDAEVLLAELLGFSRAQVRAYPERSLTEPQWAHYQQIIARRKKGEPVAYLLHRKEFWSLNLSVSPAVLIPRPETELLVEQALALFPDKTEFCRVADLGTGSGAVALALAQERPAWEIYATDQAQAALNLAAQNARDLGISGVHFLQGEWCFALPALSFDMILSNPPYLSEDEWESAERELHFEPPSALVAEEQGFRDLWEIIKEAASYLRPGGYLLLEHGWEQGAAVRQKLEEKGYSEVYTVLDLAGRERVTLGRRRLF